MIDRDIPVPLYYQIFQDIRRQILDGGLGPGAALPTEEALQRLYGVSRATVRQAVRQLASEGLVRLVRPRGTFVAEPKLTEPLPALISFSEEVRRAGLTPATRVLSAAFQSAPEDVARHLRLTQDARPLCVARLRLANEHPVAVLTSWLHPSLGIGPDQDFTGSLYALLAAHGATPERADQLLDAAGASNPIAELLQVPRRAPLLVVSRTTYDATGRPVEYVKGQYRADRYRYSVQLSRTAESVHAPGGLITV